MSQSEPTFELFPFPSQRRHKQEEPNSFPPHLWPGRSASSNAALCDTLADNHDRWHIFFDKNGGFHNHTAHVLVALWALGADEAIIKASYEACCKYQIPALKSPTPITEQNWVDHLGDQQYYRAYMHFFTEELKRLSTDTLLERYVFSPGANFILGAQKQPEMLGRLGAALHHSMIHIGYGLEFNLPGLVIEGVAQTAVHPARSREVIPPSNFGLDDTLGSQAVPALGEPPSAVSNGEKSKRDVDTHIFTILARILADPRLGNCQDVDLANMYSLVMKQCGNIIKEYVDQWSLGGDVGRKVEELMWFASIIYGVCGYEANGGFNADFFHAHIVTSSIFLQSFTPHLKHRSQLLLLQSWLSICLAFYIARGRAEINITRFFSNNNLLLSVPPGPQPTPDRQALASTSDISKTITPNPWMPILQSAIVHPDEHVPKIQRAFSHFAEIVGDTPKGTFAHTELKDADLIDGTLFVRAATLTANRLGWVREGEVPDSEFVSSGWDRRGFFAK